MNFQDDIMYSTPPWKIQVCINVIFQYALLYMISTSGSIGIFIHWLEFMGQNLQCHAFTKPQGGGLGAVIGSVVKNDPNTESPRLVDRDQPLLKIETSLVRHGSLEKKRMVKGRRQTSPTFASVSWLIVQIEFICRFLIHSLTPVKKKCCSTDM